MFQSVTASSSSRAKPDAIVVAMFSPAGNSKSPALSDSAKRLDGGSGALAGAMKRSEATGEAGQVLDVFPANAKPAERVLVLGLGDQKSLNAETLRSAAAALARRAAAMKIESLRLELEGVFAGKGAALTEDRAGQIFGEAFGLLAFDTQSLKGAANKKPDFRKVTLTAHSDALSDGLIRGVSLADSTNFSRALSNTPPNIATPDFIAKQAQALGRKTGMKVTVLKGQQLENERMIGLINVGQASINKPCLVRIEYRPSRARAGTRPVVLVGKTMTYDTGGLSLKVNNGMKGMKGDKDGGCAVLGAMHAIATVIKPRVPVVALLAVAENAVSENAYRPDDVITFRNGVSVEVTNTDAEGRLVLADALCWAADKEKPGAIIDMATLTGGVVVALGSTYAGMWCDDDALRAKVEQASEASGERVWRLPLHREYRDMMKSPIADIHNSAPVREAHPIQGAAFLSYFVPEGTPWCHLDVAGTHRVSSDKGPFVKETPTGFGVRLLAELLETY